MGDCCVPTKKKKVRQPVIVVLQIATVLSLLGCRGPTTPAMCWTELSFVHKGRGGTSQSGVLLVHRPPTTEPYWGPMGYHWLQLGGPALPHHDVLVRVFKVVRQGKSREGCCVKVVR